MGEEGALHLRRVLPALQNQEEGALRLRTARPGLWMASSLGQEEGLCLRRVLHHSQMVVCLELGLCLRTARPELRMVFPLALCRRRVRPGLRHSQVVDCLELEEPCPRTALPDLHWLVMVSPLEEGVEYF